MSPRRCECFQSDSGCTHKVVRDAYTSPPCADCAATPTQHLKIRAHTGTSVSDRFLCEECAEHYLNASDFFAWPAEEG